MSECDDVLRQMQRDFEAIYGRNPACRPYAAMACADEIERLDCGESSWTPAFKDAVVKIINRHMRGNQ